MLTIFRECVRQQPGDGEGLAVVHLHLGVHLPDAQARHRSNPPSDWTPKVKSSSLTMGCTFTAILLSFSTVGVNSNCTPKFCHCMVVVALAARACGQRIGKLAPRQEGGLLAAGGNQVGLRQHPAQVLLLQEIQEHGPQGPGRSPAPHGCQGGAEHLGEGGARGPGLPCEAPMRVEGARPGR